MLLAHEAVASRTRVTWIHSVDLLKHVLVGDRQNTMFNANTCSDANTCLNELRSELENHRKKDNFANIMESSYIKKKKRVKEVFCEEGELDVDRYLDNSPTPFVYYPYKKYYYPQETIVMDATIPHAHRGQNYMEERHEEIYKIACTSESEGRPCRVIAVDATKIPEFKDKPIIIFNVIKDFEDPIFPAIWGALKTNKSTNSLGVVIAAFFFGTKAPNCGRVVDIFIDDYIPRKELTLIKPKFLKLKQPGG